MTTTPGRITRVVAGAPPISYGTCMSRGNWWLIECEPHVMIRLKRWLSKVNSMKTGQVRIKRSPEVDRDVQAFIDRFPLEMTPADVATLHAGAEQHRDEAKVVARVLSGGYVPREFQMALTPREYQRVAADLWLRRRSLLLADDLGLGKTISAITGLADPATRPALVVAPAGLLPEQWKTQIVRCLPGLRVHILEGTRPYNIADAARKDDLAEGRMPQLAFPDVLVTNYHRLAAWAPVLDGKIKTLVIDEVQELRKTDTGKYAAATALRKDATFCIGLSATPINNYGGEFFSVMDIIEPGCLGTEEEFARDWCTGSSEKRLVSDPRAFGYYLRESGRMLRRTRKEVGRELPVLTNVPHHVDADMLAIEKISGRAGELARAIVNGGARSTRSEAMEQSGELDRLIRQATGIAKAPYVAAFVRMLVETQEKVLLFGWHRTFWDIIEEQLADLKPAFFTGAETTKQKRGGFQDFLKPSGSPILCMSLRSGSAGLDGLQGVCKTAAIGELDWCGAVHDQGVGRLHRDGQASGVFAYYLLADIGSDPTVMDVIGIKRGQSEPVRDPDADSVVPKVDPARVKKLAEAWLQGPGKGPR